MISHEKLKGSKKVLWNKTNNKFNSKKGFADGLRWVGPARHVCPELSPSLWDRAVTFSAALSQAHVSFLSTEGHLRETCMYVCVHTSLQIFSATLFLEILESLLETKFWQGCVLFYLCNRTIWSARPKLRWSLSPKSDFGLSRLFYNPMNLEGLNVSLLTFPRASRHQQSLFLQTLSSISALWFA